MRIEVDGARLWFDVDGCGLMPDGRTMRERPVLVLIHGGPGGYDHSYFKPDFAPLTRYAQLVYLDLRGHGRSSREDVRDWSIDLCVDDVAAFCEALDIDRPIVYGHSMGGLVAMRFGIRHPGQAAGLVLQSTYGRWNLDRITRGFRAVAGNEVARLAERDYGGDAVSEVEWSRVFAAFGPQVPDEAQLARRVRNAEFAAIGSRLLAEFDSLSDLTQVRCPTLVCVGDLDPITSVEAARDIVDALPDEIRRLVIIPGAGHFPWKDAGDEYWRIVGSFVDDVGGVVTTPPSS